MEGLETFRHFWKRAIGRHETRTARASSCYMSTQRSTDKQIGKVVRQARW